jgi:hypothetical protein
LSIAWSAGLIWAGGADALVGGGRLAGARAASRRRGRTWPPLSIGRGLSEPADRVLGAAAGVLDQELLDGRVGRLAALVRPQEAEHRAHRLLRADAAARQRGRHVGRRAEAALRRLAPERLEPVGRLRVRGQPLREVPELEILRGADGQVDGLAERVEAQLPALDADLLLLDLLRRVGQPTCCSWYHLSASIFGMPIFSISSLAWASLSRSIWTLAASSSRLKPSSSRAIDSRASMSDCWSPSCFSRRAIAAASWVFWMPRREASSACSRAIDDSSLMPCKRVWVWAWRRAFAREAALLRTRSSARSCAKPRPRSWSGRGSPAPSPGWR